MGLGGDSGNGGHARFGAYSRYLSSAEREGVPHWQLKGPHQAVPTHYVPQCQVEMLVTGVRHLQYVCASPAQGMNLIRMARDDEYLSELLHFIGVFTIG